MAKKSKLKNSTHKSNRLINEKSPYLLQHAHNPVDWYSWGDEAFEKARSENKPIFLSIGYSTCHWCHVMEKESFEDAEVAKLMNNTFVSIKVDREERPDIDNVYMAACNAITGAGGWPLTIIMTPDKKPFFAATYLPKEPRFNQPGLIQLIKNINELWNNRSYEVMDSADKIAFTLKFHSEAGAGEVLDLTDLTRAYTQLERRFDNKFGGFGNAPKFPTPHNLLFLLRYWRRTGIKKVLEMVELTLNKMRNGGIFDHLGFGFHRYSTDTQWLVPHFEKMLYDQALIAMAYIEVYQATGKKDYERSAREILTYVLRDMTSTEGGFYSAEDADSEGEEGKFYTWAYDEIKKILTKEEFEFFSKIYNIEKSGNYIDQITGTKDNRNILHLKESYSKLAKDFSISERELLKKIGLLQEKIYQVRKQRIHPHKDDKILTDWNGLMIAALAKGAQVFDDSSYLTAAERAMKFILHSLYTKDGELLHRFRDGEAAIPGFLDDYAFLTWGLIELYEATFNLKYLDFASELNNKMLNHFWDEELGGFYLTADNSEKLLFRQKELYDGAIPSGNSVGFLNLLRLSRLLKEPELETKASKLVRVYSRAVKQAPIAYTQFMLGLDFVIGPSYEVLIEGNEEEKHTIEMLKALRTHFIPNKIVHLNYKKMHTENFINLQSLTNKLDHPGTMTRAYVCKNYSCQKPTASIKEMLAQVGISDN